MRLVKNHFQLLTLLGLFLIAGITACVKRDFDEPPTGGEPVSITANTTIAALKALHVTPNGGFDRITGDLIIEGTVVMDDRSGNYYKTLVIQDATGGIEIKFNDGYLYNQFPVGRKMFIRCKDLILTDYNKLTQITGSTVEQGGVLEDVGLTEAQVRSKVVKGPISTTPPAPTVVTISELSSSLSKVSTLVQLKDVQFIKADTAKTYADPVTKYSLNRTLMDCDGNQIILRTSGYSEFAGAKTPTGNGTLTGVLGIYGTTLQLYVRDLNDVKMDAPRCTGVGGQLVKISDVRALYTGTTTSAPADRKISGVVISDRVANNLNGRNLYLQDESGGIVVRFTGNHSFNLGEKIEVEISSQEISEFNGLLQVNNVPLDKSVGLSDNNSPAPRVATIAEILTNFNAWESTLVQIKGATISGSGTALSGGKTVTDASGSIALFTQSYSTFASTIVPAGPVTLTAIVSDFNGKQIILRNAGDIKP